MKLIIIVLLIASSCQIFAECNTSLPLEGVLSIKTCDIKTESCVNGGKAVFDYMNNMKDEADVLNIGIQASPWRFYDGEMRILSVEELAERTKIDINKDIKRVVLLASWSGVSPESTNKSLAKKLSDALDGFPVTGMDGFLWFAKDGTVRTTHQAYSILQGGRPYGVVEGEEVMVSLAGGWPASLEKVFIDQQDAEWIMRAGAGWDILFLCPDKALLAFETAAKMGHPIAAYNAAMIRLERKSAGDLEAASVLLLSAANAGDKKALNRLTELRNMMGR